MKNFNLTKLAIVCASTVIFAMGACTSEPAQVEVPDNNVVDVVVDENPTNDVQTPAVDETTVSSGEDEVIMYPNRVSDTGALSSYGAPTVDMMNDEGSTIHIEPDGNGEWAFTVSLYRLCTFENANGVEMESGSYLFIINEDDITINCELVPEADGSYTLNIVSSNWDNLPEGDSFGNFMIQ